MKIIVITERGTFESAPDTIDADGLRRLKSLLQDGNMTYLTLTTNSGFVHIPPELLKTAVIEVAVHEGDGK
jgi:hypothetical protein